jgi:sugar lactone lactonase YvrE
VSVPAPRVTSCAFGGPELRTLFVTTARTGLDDRQLAAWPLSGSLFGVETGVPGMPAHRFGKE